MAAFEHPSFHYHGEGHAFSGHFVRPITHQIEALAGASLPLSGGHGRAQLENYEIPQLVSVKKAYSHVSGGKSQTDGNHHSHSSSVVEGLNILDMVTADRVVARLTSEHDGNPKYREGHILTVGSKFENLRISGCPVEVEIDHELFADCKSYADLSKKVAALKKSGRMAQEANGVILCSLVKKVKVDCPAVTVDKHVITVPHFGSIFLGEILSEQGFKRLTMIRLQLGSPHEGTLTATEVSLNGTHWP